MTRNDFEALFEKLESSLTGKQKKINISSVLPVYYGISVDGYRRLAFLSVSRPPKVESTKTLRVTQGKEDDGIYWTCFDLLSDNARTVYYSFCSNLVQSVMNTDSEERALSLLKNRFMIWKALFKSESSSKESIDVLRGLYGELYFLKNYLLVKYDNAKTLLSWSGPDSTSKDFSLTEMWYEVKTIGSNEPTVKISSITQLTSNTNGFLAVIRTEQMSSEYSGNDCCIADLIDSILNILSDEHLESIMLNKVSSYCKNSSDSFSAVRFNVNSVKIYRVEPGFPRITVDEVPYTAITNVSYEIAVAALEPFLEEKL